MKDTCRYHELNWGGGQITLTKDLAKYMFADNGEKLLVELTDDNKLIISKLN